MAGGVGGGLMQIGKSKAKIYVEADTGVTFDDVAGVDEAKAELQEIVAFLKDPREYGRLGGRSEEHTSELQSLMRTSYAGICLNKNKTTTRNSTAQRPIS